MIEAVGWRYFDDFFGAARTPRPDGLMVLQAITIDDDAYEVEKGSRSFASEMIFPAGCLPSREVIESTTERVTDLRILDVDDITESYPPTLRQWRANWLAAADAAERLGADDRFRRLFEFYFAWCEGGFAERRIQDLQVLFAKPGSRNGH